MMDDPLVGKRVLITGATGFIGWYLARQLHAHGAHVLALARTPSTGKAKNLAALGIEIVPGDITDHTRMTEIVNQDVQTVMHLAAWLGLSPRGKPRHFVEITNVEATRHLAEAAAAAGVERFVFTSSIAVYGLIGNVDVDETAPLKPYGNPYGDSKIRAEAALHAVRQQTGLATVIVRPGIVYGPESRRWTVRVAKEAKQGGLALVGGGRGTATIIYIDNLVDLLELCATHPDAAGEVFNAVDDGPVTWGDYLGGYMRMVPTERAIRLPCWIVKWGARLLDPFTQAKLTYMIDHVCRQGWISNQKAKDVLGWLPQVSLDEGLRRCENWLREEKIL